MATVNAAVAPTLADAGAGAAIDDAQPPSPAPGDSDSDDDAPAAPPADPYYWQADRQPNPLELVTHNAHWLAWQLLGGVEFVGELFSEIFSLQSSRYAWAQEAERNRVVSWRGGGAVRRSVLVTAMTSSDRDS